jgi:hypothetical protein
MPKGKQFDFSETRVSGLHCWYRHGYRTQARMEPTAPVWFCRRLRSRVCERVRRGGGGQ